MRKLLLSVAFLLVSAAYVWSQAGRAAAPVRSAEATVPVATQVRLAKNQIVTVKDGTFRGKRYDARFGYVSASIKVSGGRIVEVTFEEYPDHSPTSVKINLEALPKLEQEVIVAQSPNVDVVTGATLTSKAWSHSVRSAIRAAAF